MGSAWTTSPFPTAAPRVWRPDPRMLSPARLLLKRGGTHIWERGDDPGECFIDPVYGGCQVGAPLAQTTPLLPVPRSKEKIPAWQPSRLGKSRGTPLIGEAAEG